MEKKKKTLKSIEFCSADYDYTNTNWILALVSMLYI